MKPWRAWPEAVLIRRPPRPCLRIRAIASWQHRNTPLVLTAMTLSHSASVIASIWAMVMTPAFCTEMSTPPKFLGEIVERRDIRLLGDVHAQRRPLRRRCASAVGDLLDARVDRR